MLTAAEEAAEKDLPVKIQTLDCPNEDEAIIDRPATLRCALARSLTQVSEVFLMYREPNRERFTEQRMTKSPKGWYVGKIPRKAVIGKRVSYYFEGRDAAPGSRSSETARSRAQTSSC